MSINPSSELYCEESTEDAADVDSLYQQSVSSSTSSPCPLKVQCNSKSQVSHWSARTIPQSGTITFFLFISPSHLSHQLRYQPQLAPSPFDRHIFVCDQALAVLLKWNNHFMFCSCYERNCLLHLSKKFSQKNCKWRTKRQQDNLFTPLYLFNFIYTRIKHQDLK